MRRRYALLVLILVILAVGAAVVQRILFPPVPKLLEVVSVRGEVTVDDPEKGSGALVAGGKILPGASVRTGDQGEAILQGKGNSTITVSDHAKVRLDEVTSDGTSRLAIEEGRVRAVVPEGSGGGVEITGGKDKASVATRGGDVAVAVDGRGQLSVAAFQGKANMTAGGATSEVKAGEFAVVSGGKVQVGAIPTTILTKVAWPETAKTNDPVAKVAVQAPPGATVRINDKPVVLDSAGHGVVAVNLREGDNQLHMYTEDVAGNRNNAESSTIVLDTKPPDPHVGKPHWGSK